MNENVITNENPWTCNDCGEQQQLVTHNGKSHYSSNGWYRVQLRPGAKPVYLDMGCFNSYDEDWPDYEGTHETSAWRWGEWEGKGLWVLPADYFERRDAYRRLPRWETDGSGMKLITYEGQILGRVDSYKKFGKRVYRAYDEQGRVMSGRIPMSLQFAKGMVEVRHKLADEGMVQR